MNDNDSKMQPLLEAAIACKCLRLAIVGQIQATLYNNAQMLLTRI
jgi:hypothetical protein